MPYIVAIDDNFHHGDESERTTAGTHETAAGAIAHAKSIVDEWLTNEWVEGMTAARLYARYTSFGDDPFIVARDAENVRFSAWDYALERAAEMCPAGQADAAFWRSATDGSKLFLTDAGTVIVRLPDGSEVWAADGKPYGGDSFAAMELSPDEAAEFLAGGVPRRFTLDGVLEDLRHSDS